MSDPVGTHVYDPRGPMHTGAGNIIIQPPGEARGPGPRRQALDELSWIAQRFIYPEGSGLAREILKSRQAVLLDAPPGSGRVATAKVLLWELRHGAERFHELLLPEDENRLDLTLVGTNDRIWLDLTEVTESGWSKIRGELSSLRTAVLERSAYLVVVLPFGASGLPTELAQFRVRIEPPPTLRVLSRYLRCEGLWTGTLPPLEFLDQERPPEDISNFVDLVTEAREQAGGRGDLAGWCQAAYRSWVGSRADVGERIAKLPDDGQTRALLLAAAMLHGSHADTVHEGSQSLINIVQHPVDGRSALQSVPLGQRLKKIRATTDAAGRVMFEDPGYDEAIRVFFWKNIPELHDPLRRWVAQIGGSAAMRLDGDLERLALRFGEQCRADRYRSSWAPLVEQWTTDAAPVRLMDAASLILREGIRDKAHGRAFRRQIYDWATGSFSDRLGAVMVEVCRGDMAVNHPDEALVRLHHVARRERGTLARDALLELARSDRRFFRQMLSRLAEPRPERRSLAADVQLYLQLAEPGALTDPGERGRALIKEDAVQGWLTAGWQFAFAEPLDLAWSAQARQWLRHAADDEAHRDLLLDVLIAAARRRADVMALLFSLRSRRHPVDGFGELLLQKISTAQGLSFT